jgi:pilus assembly protein CpaF
LEETVQERAREQSVDMADPAATQQLEALVEDAIADWSDAHRRGHRPFALVDPHAVADRVLRNLTGYGPLEPLLADDDVWEIMVNAPDDIFVKRHRGTSGYHDESFHDDDHVTRTLTKILDDAGGSHRKFDPAEGLQDAQLVDGSRLHIVHRELSRGDHVLVNIRKFTGVPFTSLSDLVERDTLSPDAANLLQSCVRARTSIVFAGAPGSGKTTLLACCAAELDPTLRVVSAEEVLELDLPLPNVAQLQTRPARAERPAVDLRQLVAGFLRMAPDVAIVGEVREREALPLLLTLSSGVKGYTTVHAGSARQALARLRFVCQLSDTSLPIDALTGLVADTVDLVVHLSRGTDGPRVDEIVAVEDAGSGSSTFTCTTLFDRTSSVRDLSWTGHMPIRLDETLRAVGVDLRRSLGANDGVGTR